MEKEKKEKIKRMMNYEGKMTKKVPKKFIETYKDVYFYLMEKLSNGSLKQHENYLGENELAKSIYINKYFLRDLDNSLIEERPEDVFIRISAFLASVEDEKAYYWAERFYEELFDGLWLPAGRVIAGCGDIYRLKTLSNCFVSIIEEDNIESIYKTAYEAARTYSYGGGIGIDITCLRPKNAVVHNAAQKSTGAVSFMDLYNLTTGLIGQSGRRGALMLTIHVKHPDIIDFIKAKKEENWLTSVVLKEIEILGIEKESIEKIKKIIIDNFQLRFANISIKFTDEFFNALIEEKNYGNAYLVYKKLEKGRIMETKQGKNIHFSNNMPSKKIENYQLLFKSNSLKELNEWLNKFLEKYSISVVINEKELEDPYKRDVYGDYVIELPEKFDLAIKKAGDFLLFFSSNETGTIKKLVKASEIWHLFIESNYKSAEPGCIFWDVMKAYSVSDYLGKPIITTNPCGEVPLEDGGSCNLGSINLARFVKNPYKNALIDYEKLEKAIETLNRALDNAIEWNIYLNPLEKQREAAKTTRRQGIGIMGLADMLMFLQIAYDDEKALDIIEKVMKSMANNSYKISAYLAKEKGSVIFDYENYSKNPFFQAALEEKTKKIIGQHGLRNITLLSIAPTGTISNIVKSFEHEGKNYIGVSNGIEPLFSLYYLRRTESMGENKVFKVLHSTINAFIDINNGQIKEDFTEEEIRKMLPYYMQRTAYVIDPKKRVEIQAIAQKYVDNSISSTVNLPVDIEPEILSEIYIYAWEKKLKGLTIYREASRFPILAREKTYNEFLDFAKKRFKLVVNGKTFIVNGDDIIKLNGKLTTVYHAIKNGQLRLS